MIPTYLLVATFVAGLHASYGIRCTPRRCHSQYCVFGFTQDDMGCNTCSCRTTDPCEENNCGFRERCEINERRCRQAPCQPTICVQLEEEFECPEVYLGDCPYGNELDELGCYTSQCKPNPCEGHMCEAGTKCEAQRRPCISEPCHTHYDAVCVANLKCTPPMKVGPCDASIPRYYFDQAAKMCKPFDYGGCEGNDNNFETAENCKEECGHECPGVCRMDCPWGFKLDEFGCEICECNPHPCAAVQCEADSKCVPVKTECTETPCPVQYTGVCKSTTDCQLPKVVGNCRASIPRYFFNTAIHECEQFNYGGCDGNGNNFETMKACTEFCAGTPRSVIACEDEPVELQCSGGTSIEILYANFGRTSTAVCRDWDYSNDNCTNHNRSKKVMSEQCDGASTCSVAASDSVFGDPCYGTWKYLEVRYQCIQLPDIITKIVCEEEQAILRCPSGTTINMKSSFYGRTTLEHCPHRRWNYRETDCTGSRRSMVVMSRRCNGENMCSVEVSNSNFGDPCFNNWKYLEVRYQCIASSRNTN